MNLFSQTTLFSVICLAIGDLSEKVSDYVRQGIENCKENSSLCHNNQFFDSDVTQISPSWFVFAAGLLREFGDGSGDTCRGSMSPVPGWQGAMYYTEPVSAEEIYSGDHREALYIYPDWSSCVEGVWEHHMLIEGEIKTLNHDL